MKIRMLSQNNRQKKCAPSKDQTRKPPSVDVSSDNDSYAGVEQISDSEEDEPNVEKEEERAIIFSEDRTDSMNTTQNILDDTTWEGFSDIPYLGDGMSLFGQDSISEDKWCLRTEVAKRDESAEYDTAFGDQSVQFESSDDEFDMFDDLFPDIFINKDHLDSSFRRQIDHDDISDEGSYWEYDDVGDTFGIPSSNPYTPMEIPKNEEYEEFGSDSSSLTGYESDISGETTDDDLPAEYYLQHRRAAVSIPEVESDAEVEDTDNSSPASTPRLYSWKHTSDKPFATVSSNCKKMILFNVRGFRNLGPSRSPQLSGGQKVGEANSLCLNTNTKNINISTLQNPPLSNSNTMISTELPEFYAPLAVETGLDMTSYSSSFYDSDEFGEGNCTETSPNLDEFINFEPDESSFSTREAESSHIDVNTTTSICSSKTNTEDQIHPLISHFNRGVVGSWRQKQNTHKLLHRNIVTPDSIGFGGNRFMEGTLKGVKSGRLRHANTPITPVRKQRPLASLDIAIDIKSTTSSTVRKSSNTHRHDTRTLKRRKIKM
ncbi:hypothetical protein OnM2_060030 [Erysiphe neolycopersici]|uniref:Uncharacterized protein n=1 Tax=Erysiphe neolycopersici TaxID=212602 RepID=A0A420HPS0_9PEZI|nr:hypothetical protein OnM2_060030 [Erysiphe neolycopersici]